MYSYEIEEFIGRFIKFILCFLFLYVVLLASFSFIITDRMALVRDFGVNRIKIYKEGELIAYERRGLISFVNGFNMNDRFYTLKEINMRRKEVLKNQNK